MTDKQPEALRLADSLEEMSATFDMGRKPDPKCKRRQAANLLRTQHAEIEDLRAAITTTAEALARKDALLRQALEALGCTHEEGDPGHRCGHCDDYVDRNGTLRSAIAKELSQ